MDKGAKIIGGNGERLGFDFYPTPEPVTVALMEFLSLPKQTVIWEPACGEGHMVKVMRRYCPEVIATDIQSGDDYLQTKMDGVDAIITNPPFSLSQQFIEKSLSDAPTVAMLLKTQYWHAAKRQEIFTAYPPAWVLALTWRPNFFGAKATGAPTMDFIWTVWLHGDTNTKYRLLKKPNEAAY